MKFYLYAKNVTIKLVLILYSVFMKNIFNIIICLSIIIFLNTNTNASINHLVINEVEYDSPWNESEWEWIELYNPTLNDINLDNWSISEKTTSWFKYFVFSDILIPSWGFILIVNDTTEFNNIYPNVTVNIDLEWLSYFKLKNTPYDELTLKDAEWSIIDYVSWENIDWWWDIESINSPICRVSRFDTDTVSDWTNDCISTPWYSNMPNYVPTDIILSNTLINENNALLDVIWNLSTNDLDILNTHDYSLVTWIWDIDNSFFILDWNILKLNVVSDYEAKSSYDIRIGVNDNSWWVFEKAFTININDLDDQPPVILINADDIIFEIWTVSDSDINNSIMYTCTDNFDSECNVILSWNDIDITLAWTYIVRFNAIDSSWNSALEVTKKIIIKELEIKAWNWWNWWLDPNILLNTEVIYPDILQKKNKENKIEKLNQVKVEVEEEEEVIDISKNTQEWYFLTKGIIGLDYILDIKLINYLWYYSELWFMEEGYFGKFFKNK